MNVTHRRKKILKFKLIPRIKEVISIKFLNSPLYNSEVMMIKKINYNFPLYDYNPSTILVKKYINLE